MSPPAVCSAAVAVSFEYLSKIYQRCSENCYIYLILKGYDFAYFAQNLSSALDTRSNSHQWRGAELESIFISQGGASPHEWFISVDQR